MTKKLLCLSIGLAFLTIAISSRFHIGYCQSSSLSIVNSTNDTIIHVLSNRNVGIGTTNPQGILHVDGGLTSGRSILLTAGSISGGTAGSISLQSGFGFFGNGGTMNLYAGSGSGGGSLNLRSGDAVSIMGNGGDISFTSGSGGPHGGNMTWTTGNGIFPGSMTWTGGIGASIATFSFINGNVGIGTSALSEKLEVAGNVKIGAATIRSGIGSPEGVVTGNVGDLFMRSDGGLGSTMYVKESGNGTNTGWAAK